MDTLLIRIKVKNQNKVMITKTLDGSGFAELTIRYPDEFEAMISCADCDQELRESEKNFLNHLKRIFSLGGANVSDYKKHECLCERDRKA